MPTSNLALAPDVIYLVEEIPPAERRRILDVGPGHGKYAILLREYLNDPPDEISAVEAWEPYVEEFGLRRLYDSVIAGDVMDVVRRPIEENGLGGGRLDRYDVVLLVDVFEHLTAADGIELVERTRGRLVILTPAEYFQNPEHEEIPPESHRSHWPSKDFVAVFGDRIERIYENLGGVLVRLGPRPADVASTDEDRFLGAP